MNPVQLYNYPEFAAGAKSYASAFSPCAILDSCSIKSAGNNSKFKLLIAFGGQTIIEPKVHKIETLFEIWQEKKTWLFGVLGFDLKNEIENLHSLNNHCFHWPQLSFFIPQTIIQVSWDDVLTIEGENAVGVYENILNHSVNKVTDLSIQTESHLISDFSSKEHKRLVNDIKEEILNGNVYELNLCSRFLYPNIIVSNPYSLFSELIKISPAPFSGYFAIGNKFVLSASPERYLSKNKQHLVSQPIKGTRPRSEDTRMDEALKNDLKNNLKDQAENVMIVDLVRNDLARVSVPGSVKVEELFGIYSYSHVHQMVSSICSEMEDHLNWKDAIKASFPMGSMTGTPKIAALQWIEKFETSAREWYSGGLGYIDPEGNMDFNVLIRSLFYDSQQNKLAYYAGGAITIDSNPEEEYHEMMVKARAIETLLKQYL